MAGMGIAAAAPGAQPDQAPQQQQQQPDQGRQGDDGTQPNVSPEEQDQYDQFVTNGMKLIYRDDGKDSVQVNPSVLGQLRGQWDDVKPSLGEIPDEEKPLDPKNPIDNLAVATVALILTLEASAANQNKQVDPIVLFHGGTELMEQLADIADAASIHDFTTDELTGAANRAAMLYGVSSKSVDKQQALAEFDNFLKTQGDQLGSELGQIAQQGGGGQAEEQAEPSDNPQEEDEEQ